MLTAMCEFLQVFSLKVPIKIPADDNQGTLLLTVTIMCLLGTLRLSKFKHIIEMLCYEM